MPAPHRSAIAWTDYSGGDANFVKGCTPVSEGCANCYARAIYERFGREFGNVQVSFEALDRLARWKPRPPWKRMDSTRAYTERPMVFVCDTGDLFHDDVPAVFIEQAMDMMRGRSDVDWQVLTKRPLRMLQWWAQSPGYLPDNIWLGVSIENQARADTRVPLLLQVPAAVRFVSVEPMLGPVDLRRWLRGLNGTQEPRVHLVICGAESGPNRREFDVQWALDLYHQCREAGVPFFYKQGSALRPGCNAHLPGYGVVQEWPYV
jgi:protein gp37